MEKAIPLQGEGARDKSYHLQSHFFWRKTILQLLQFTSIKLM